MKISAGKVETHKLIKLSTDFLTDRQTEGQR